MRETMKRVFAILIAAALLLLSLTACGRQPQETPSLEPAPTPTAAETPAPPDPEMLYRPVLAQYRDAQAQDFYAGRLGELAPEDANLNFELLLAAASYQAQGIPYRVYYAFHDLDGNGTPELLVGGMSEFKGQSENALPELYGVYAYDGEKPVALAFAGARVDLNLYQNGAFILHGSGGAGYDCYTFCKIAPNGYEREVVDEVYIHYLDENAAPVYSHDLDRKDAMFAREFEVLLQSYNDIGSPALDWMALTE